jgi:hypothetical protein
MSKGKLHGDYISTYEAGALLGCNHVSIETGLRNGTFPIGWAWHTGDGDKRGQWNYRIPRQGLLRAIETGVVPKRPVEAEYGA